jgi:hypothetical protein
MVLNYDFDIFSVFPKAVFDDPKVGGMLAELGFEHQQRGNHVALFRDPRTVEALRQAPQAVQDYLRGAGFGMNTYHSGAPAGRYPAEDEPARVALIEKLAEELSRHNLPKSDDSQPNPEAFNLPAFFEAVVMAEPLAADAPLMDPVMPVPFSEPAAAAGKEPGRRLLRLPFPMRLPLWMSRLVVVATVGSLTVYSVVAF